MSKFKVGDVVRFVPTLHVDEVEETAHCQVVNCSGWHDDLKYRWSFSSAVLSKVGYAPAPAEPAPPRFKIGDVVQLKSGGPLMTVGINREDDLVIVQWANAKLEIDYDHFHEDMLQFPGNESKTEDTGREAMREACIKIAQRTEIDVGPHDGREAVAGKLRSAIVRAIMALET